MTDTALLANQIGSLWKDIWKLGVGWDPPETISGPEDRLRPLYSVLRTFCYKEC